MPIDDHIDKRKNPMTNAKDMSDKERIDFIRDYADDYIVRAVNKLILDNNKYKIVREKQWERMDRGKRIVARIIRKHLNG